MHNKLRLSKRIADLGHCSRREAEFLIESAWVLVNGDLVKEQGFKVSLDDKVEILSQGLDYINKKQTIAIYKPIGYVCHASQDKYPHVFDLLQKENALDPDYSKINSEGFAPVGRLDIDSKGLLILSQDGRIAKAIISATTKIEKIYVVKLDKELSEKEIETIALGKAWPEEGQLKAVKIEKIGPALYKMALKEGKNRQIRKMIEFLGLRVFMLKRIQIGPVSLEGLKEGQWRFLKDSEKSSIISNLKS